MQLFEHQKKGINKVIKNGGRGALFWDMGLGKTRGAIEIFRHFKSIDNSCRFLVVCPISLIEAAWVEDIQKFTDFTFCNVRKEIKDADIYIVNYESLSAKLTKLVDKNISGIVLDESSRIKNNKAQITKFMLKIRHKFKYRIVMSGTPAPNIEWEYWPQITFVDDFVLHYNFYHFKNNYFHLERNGQRMFTNGQIMNKLQAREVFSKGWKYSITQDKREDLINRISKFSDFARKEDCLDLPEKIDENVFVELDGDQAKAYKELQKDLITEFKGKDIVATVALAKIIKLREICSGFAISTGAAVVEFEKNPKLRVLEEILEDIGNKQVIIWCNFTYEIERIYSLLKDKSACLYGKTKNSDEVIKDFKDGKIQYLIANPSCAGYGLTFTNCSYQVFFSLSYSWEDYEQSRDRIYRIGQINKCTYIHILAKNTIDEVILGVLKRKGDASDFVFSFLKNA